MFSLRRGTCLISNYHRSKNVTYRNEYLPGSCKKILREKLITVIGYGDQGKAHACNIKHKVPTILGVIKNSNCWNNAIKDGWNPGYNLFDIDEASYKGDVVMYLLSESEQKTMWETVKSNLTCNKTLYFSNTINMITEIDSEVLPPDNIDVISVEPHCDGDTVRKNFINDNGFISTYNIHQNYTGEAKENCKAIGFLIGSKYMYI
uniref:Acetohydroxy acid isomeroreductase n=1 Tax=Megaviridae environmental sample TaxID=1737588 RepID=A0A5J6VJT5_9VIRU|nr:MAG: acetohydroxy acid isomeroreductase [Megaviridae environmental sample]